MPRPTPPPYKSTFLDRHGPEGAVWIRMASRLPLIGLTSLFAGYGLGTEMHATGWGMAAAIFLCGPAIGATFTLLSFLFINYVGRGANSVYMGGPSTPYEEQYSREQALIMQGNVDQALESFESIIAQSPELAAPRLRAAEVYAGQKRYARAAELFVDVQRHPSVTVGNDVLATNRIADLHLGPLNDRRRAMDELRGIVRRHPGTQAAANARTALAALARAES